MENSDLYQSQIVSRQLIYIPDKVIQVRLNETLEIFHLYV